MSILCLAVVAATACVPAAEAPKQLFDASGCAYDVLPSLSDDDPGAIKLRRNPAYDTNGCEPSGTWIPL